MYVPLDDKGEKWQTHVIDDNRMACEDLKIADLDGDGQPDIIASTAPRITSSSTGTVQGAMRSEPRLN